MRVGVCAVVRLATGVRGRVGEWVTLGLGDGKRVVVRAQVGMCVLLMSIMKGRGHMAVCICIWAIERITMCVSMRTCMWVILRLQDCVYVYAV